MADKDDYQNIKSLQIQSTNTKRLWEYSTQTSDLRQHELINFINKLPRDHEKNSDHRDQNSLILKRIYILILYDDTKRTPFLK